MSDAAEAQATEPQGTQPLFPRVLLKISGETLMGDQGFGLHPPTVQRVAREIKRAYDLGIQLCLVIGGGNIFRGLHGATQGHGAGAGRLHGHAGHGDERARPCSPRSRIWAFTRACQSAIPMDTVCEPYIRRRAIRHLEKGRVVIFAAGTGNPYFTTDTAATLRAMEMNCDAIFKGTRSTASTTATPGRTPPRGATRA